MNQVSGKNGFALRFAPHLSFPSMEQPPFLHSAGSVDPVAQIRYAAEQGFAGVEDIVLVERSKTDQDRMGAELARTGLEMGCFTLNREDTWKPLLGSNDPDARAYLIKAVGIAIEAAKRVNGKRICVAQVADTKIPLGYQWAAAGENLKRMGAVAEKAGMMLVVEPVAHYRIPNMLFASMSDTYAVLKIIDTPSVRLLFDVFHAQMQDGNIIDNMTRCWDMIAVIQAADTPGRFELGSGELNWPNILKFALDKGYRGLIGLEHGYANPGRDGEQRALESLRRVDAATAALLN